MARACRENGCALLGGETAEMPGFYADGEYDLAGFIVGVVDRGVADRRQRIAPGDVLIGVALDRPAHQRLLARAPHRLRASRAHARTPSCPSSATTVGDALLGRTAPICSVVRPLLERRARSRAWRTSPAAASPTTCRASCRRAGGAHRSQRVARCRRSSSGCMRRGRVCRRRHVAHLQHGHRPDHRDRRAACRPRPGGTADAGVPDARGIGDIVAGDGGRDRFRPTRLSRARWSDGAAPHDADVSACSFQAAGAICRRIIDAVADGRLGAAIGVVISNVAGAAGLDRRRAAGIRDRRPRPPRLRPAPTTTRALVES